MARLRYNGLGTTLGAALTSTDTTITFAAALTHSGGTAVPTISGTDYIPLTILASSDPDSAASEIVYLTAYTSGATTGTITRAQESTTGVAHSSGVVVVNAPTALDFTASAGTGETTYTAPTLLNSWANFGTPYANAGYLKDANGFVHLRGLVKSGSAGSIIFMLPAGYRPASEMLTVTNSSSGTQSNIIVRANGEVVANTGGTAHFSLEIPPFLAA